MSRKKKRTLMIEMLKVISTRLALMASTRQKKVQAKEYESFKFQMTNEATVIKTLLAWHGSLA